MPRRFLRNEATAHPLWSPPLCGQRYRLLPSSCPQTPSHSNPALAQVGAPYVDPDNGISFFGSTELGSNVRTGYVFPPSDSTGDLANEFIGEIVSPVGTAWVGLSPIGTMLQALLLVAWVNDGKIVSSVRFAT